MAQNQEFDLDEPINLNTTFVSELNFGSMDFIQLVVTIEDSFQQKIGFHDLLMSQGRYVEDISIGELVSFVEQQLDSNTLIPTVNKPVSPTRIIFNDTEDKIDSTKVAQFRQTIDMRIAQLESLLDPKTAKSEPTTKNGQAIFILSPPRSGSTLLRIILAGHPQLFAPPELHLLPYLTLNQRKNALAGEVNSHLLQGTMRAIMQLKNCTAQEAESFMQDCENQNLTTKEFYHLLQQDLENQILVDKTPTYPSHLDILKRAETYFENPLYIHLLRHPYGMINSYEGSKLERIVPIMNEASFTRRELAELTWLISHENILEFFKDIPENRKLAIKFEDLVNDPEATIKNQCQFFGLEFEPKMLDIYKDKQERMTDGVYGVSEMSGDLKFHLHRGIESNVAQSWKQEQMTDYLGDLTWKLANSLGYFQDK
jgi:acyl carrier protein